MSDESAIVRLTKRVRVKAHDRRTDFGLEFIKTFIRRQREGRDDVGSGKTKRAVFDDAQKADRASDAKASKAVNVSGKVTTVCPECHGKGSISSGASGVAIKTCPTCKGAGVVFSSVSGAVKKATAAKVSAK